MHNVLETLLYLRGLHKSVKDIFPNVHDHNAHQEFFTKFPCSIFFEEIDIFPPGTIDCEDSGMSNYPGNNYKPLIGSTHKKALHRKVVTINLQDGNCACPSIIDHLLDIQNFCIDNYVFINVTQRGKKTRSLAGIHIFYEEK